MFAVRTHCFCNQMTAFGYYLTDVPSKTHSTPVYDQCILVEIGCCAHGSVHVCNDMATIHRVDRSWSNVCRRFVGRVLALLDGTYHGQRRVR